MFFWCGCKICLGVVDGGGGGGKAEGCVWGAYAGRRPHERGGKKRETGLDSSGWATHHRKQKERITRIWLLPFVVLMPAVSVFFFLPFRCYVVLSALLVVVFFSFLGGFCFLRPFCCCSLKT